MYLSKNRMVRVKVQHSISASTKLILSLWISCLRNEVYGLLFQHVWIWSWFSIYRFYNSGSIIWLLCCIFIICKIEINNNNIKHIYCEYYFTSCKFIHINISLCMFNTLVNAMIWMFVHKDSYVKTQFPMLWY